jgi:hypothetical protein
MSKRKPPMCHFGTFGGGKLARLRVFSTRLDQAENGRKQM